MFSRFDTTRLCQHRALRVILAVLVLFVTGSVPAYASPLAISSVAAGNITDTTAIITWSTDELANSTVSYGTTTALGLTESDAAFVADHAVNLTGLAPGTTYYYEVESTNQAGNETITDDNGGAYYTFATTDSVLPVISGVQATSITETSAFVIWNTDEAADSLVNYGNTTSLGQSVSDGGLTTNHSLPLTGLQPGTTYYYEVQSTDAANNTATDNDSGTYYSFTTLVGDSTPPVISNVQATDITGTTATVSWDTDEAADSVVNYGETTALGSTESNAALVVSRSILLSGLTPNTTYYYEVESTDSANNTATDDNSSAYYTFTTLDTVAPVISNVQATGITGTSATITWTTDENADSAVNYGETTALGSTESDASLITSHSIDITGLSPNTTYYYEVQSTDSANNTATDDNSGGYYTFTTLDTVAPLISNVQTSDITGSTASVSWDTDEAADSVVNYGETTALGSTESNANLVVSRSIMLAGLTPNTTYYYEVQSTDSANNTATDDNSGAYYTFTTLDTVAPIISSVQTTGITGNSATITWTTDEPADSVVDYGETTALGSTETDASLITSHSIDLTGLSPNTTYYYEVQSADAANNTATDDNSGAYYTFTTLDTVAPVISNVQTSDITGTTATVSWDTDEAADSAVNYGETTALGSTESNASLVVSRSIMLTGLVPNTTYYYEVQSTDAANNTATDDNGGAYYSFTTLDTVAPVISSVQAMSIGDFSATITWTTDESADSVVNYGETTALGSTESDASLVTAHSIDLTGLSPGITYYYEVQSTDAANNTSTDDNGGAYYTFTTSDTTPPVVSNVQTTNVTGNSATITWDTDESADSAVNYGETTALGSTETDASLVTSHSIDLTGLSPNTTYYYEVQSTDVANNTATDDNSGAYYSFTTLDTVAPVISNIQSTNITGNSATITWSTDENADSVVNYGETTALGSTESDAGLIPSHSIDLMGLTPNTTYYYEVQSTDSANNTATDDNGGAYYTFTTLDTVAPVISNVQTSDITGTTATVSWDTDEAADSVVNYGETTALGSTESNSNLVVSRSIMLAGLVPNTTYYYEVESTDSANNTATDDNSGTYYTFTTLDTVAPVISNVQAGGVTDTSATITWNTDEPADSGDDVSVRGAID